MSPAVMKLCSIVPLIPARGSVGGREAVDVREYQHAKVGDVLLGCAEEAAGVIAKLYDNRLRQICLYCHSVTRITNGKDTVSGG
jgi:monoamine oxidase